MLPACQTKKAIPVRQIQLSPTVAGIVQAMVAYAKVDDIAIGEDGYTSPQWYRFEALCKAATRQELHDLVNDDHPVLSCYAFRALANRLDSAVFPILLAHLHDTAKVSTQSGCIVMEDFVGDFFIRTVTQKHLVSPSYMLNEVQHHVLDSILLYDKQMVLNAKDGLLSSMKPNPTYYARIKEIAVKQHNEVALLAL
ncbi:hypothetical protein DCM91_00635 [Chitinophaga costaii]|nr:hypothetical protein DCM91_00635 [Chitinophaga costaii]